MVRGRELRVQEEEFVCLKQLNERNYEIEESFEKMKKIRKHCLNIKTE